MRIDGVEIGGDRRLWIDGVEIGGDGPLHGAGDCRIHDRVDLIEAGFLAQIGSQAGDVARHMACRAGGEIAQGGGLVFGRLRMHAELPERDADRIAQRFRRLEALRAILGHRLGDQLVAGGTELGALEADVRHRRGAVLVQDLLQFAAVGGFGGEAEVEHGAERVDVAADVERRIGDDLLRRHVERTADDRPFHRQHGARRFGGACNAEIGELGIAVRGDEDVGWLDVAVDQLDAVGFGEAIGHLVDDRQREGLGQAALGIDQVAQVAGVDIFQNQELGALVTDAAVQTAYDIAMIQLASDAGFAGEAAQAFSGRRAGSLRWAGADGLDHHQALVVGAAGEPHAAHAAIREMHQRLVGPERLDVIRRQ